MSMTSKCIHLHYKRLHWIIVFMVKGRHVKLAFGCAVDRMNVLHVTDHK